MTEEVIQAEQAAPEGEAIVENQAESTPAPAVEEKPKADPVQKRFDKLTRDKYQARAEADMLRRELERLQSQQQAPRQQAQATGAPKLEDFDNFDAYVEAKAAFIADQRLDAKLSEREKRDQERRSQEDSAKTAETWNKRLSDVRKEVPDYDDVIESADIVITQAMGQAIMDSEMGPKVALYLARNPDEAERLIDLHPSAVARAIGRIEAKIENESLASKASAAPKPATPVGSRSGASNGPADNQSIEDWMKARNAQLKRK